MSEKITVNLRLPKALRKERTDKTLTGLPPVKVVGTTDPSTYGVSTQFTGPSYVIPPVLDPRLAYKASEGIQATYTAVVNREGAVEESGAINLSLHPEIDPDTEWDGEQTEKLPHTWYPPGHTPRVMTIRDTMEALFGQACTYAQRHGDGPVLQKLRCVLIEALLTVEDK